MDCFLLSVCFYIFSSLKGAEIWKVIWRYFASQKGTNADCALSLCFSQKRSEHFSLDTDKLKCFMDCNHSFFHGFNIGLERLIRC